MKSLIIIFFFFSSRRRHTRFSRDWSSDVCSSDLKPSLDTTWWGIMVLGEEPKHAGAQPESGIVDVAGFTARAFLLGDAATAIVFDPGRGRAVELPRGRPAIADAGL